MAVRRFQDLVAPYPPAVQALAVRARGLIIELLPEVDETVDGSGPYATYGYGAGYKGVICYLTVSRTGVKLGLAGGASLPDPRGLLAGTGKAHRHIPLTSDADLRRPGVRPLIRAASAAWKQAAVGAGSPRPRVAAGRGRAAR